MLEHVALAILSPACCSSDKITGGKDRRRYEYNKGMPNEVDAVYENGILKPLQPLDLAENERVVVSITQKANGAGLGQLDADFVEGLRRRLANAAPAPGLEEVRRRLSKIPGSMTADFIAEREDR